jgi:diguanylate cyclase (GGDEF)-like protein
MEPERRIDEVATLLRKLTGELIQTVSLADLFGTAFKTLCDVLPIDIGVAVTLEQNLHLYVSTRPGLRGLVNDALIGRILAALEDRLAVSLALTDVVVRSERNDLPGTEARIGAMPHDLRTPFEVENRTAGLLMVFRETPPFSATDESVLAIFSAHLAVHTGNLRARERMMLLAETDELTGIANKRHFRRRLGTEMERARTYNIPLTLILLDIDDFKHVNDTHGHMIGDVMLSEFCGTINDMLRPPDFFARFGGDEFALILPHTDVEGACSVADRIIAQVRDLAIFSGDETQVRCSVSLGIAAFNPEFLTPEEFVRKADLKLYDSKRLGKSRYTA